MKTFNEISAGCIAIGTVLLTVGSRLYGFSLNSQYAAASEKPLNTETDKIYKVI